MIEPVEKNDRRLVGMMASTDHCPVDQALLR